MVPRTQAYPWAALELVEREAERSLRVARRFLEPAADPRALAAALSALLGVQVQLFVRGIDRRAPEAASCRVGLSIDGLGGAVVGMEPALASALLGKLLRRPVPIVHPETTLDAALGGALAAIVIEGLRAADARLAVRPAKALPESAAPIVHLSAVIGGKPYLAAVWIAPRVAPPPAPQATELLARLADTELALSLVVAQNLASPRELAKLTPGAVWAPGAGFSVDRELRGRGVLVARTSARGLGVDLGPFPRIVLREPAAAPLSAPDGAGMEGDETTEPVTLADAVLDAPLVVRVELAEVSLPAREWAELAAGDVIETGRRIAEPVTLSAGGRVLARGELVNVEGELGVRVTEIVARP